MVVAVTDRPGYTAYSAEMSTSNQLPSGIVRLNLQRCFHCIICTVNVAVGSGIIICYRRRNLELEYVRTWQEILIKAAIANLTVWNTRFDLRLKVLLSAKSNTECWKDTYESLKMYSNCTYAVRGSCDYEATCALAHTGCGAEWASTLYAEVLRGGESLLLPSTGRPLRSTVTPWGTCQLAHRCNT